MEHTSYENYPVSALSFSADDVSKLHESDLFYADFLFRQSMNHNAQEWMNEWILTHKNESSSMFGLPRFNLEALMTDIVFFLGYNYLKNEILKILLFKIIKIS